MFRILVVATRGGDAALRWAGRHARAGEGGIEVVVCSTEFTDPTAAIRDAGRLLATTGVPCAVRPHEGSVADALESCPAADLVVLGTTEGDEPRRVLAHAPCPVVIVPPDGPASEEPPLTAVLADADDPALGTALGCARATGRAVVLVTEGARPAAREVLTSPSAPSPARDRPARARAAAE